MSVLLFEFSYLWKIRVCTNFTNVRNNILQIRYLALYVSWGIAVFYSLTRLALFSEDLRVSRWLFGSRWCAYRERQLPVPFEYYLCNRFSETGFLFCLKFAVSCAAAWKEREINLGQFGNFGQFKNFIKIRRFCQANSKWTTNSDSMASLNCSEMLVDIH